MSAVAVPVIPSIPANASVAPAAPDTVQPSSSATPRSVLQSNQPLPTLSAQLAPSAIKSKLDSMNARGRDFLASKESTQGTSAVKDSDANRLRMLGAIDATTDTQVDLTKTPANFINVFATQRIRDTLATAQESASVSVTRSTPIYATTPYATNKYSDPVAFAMKKRVTKKNVQTGQVQTLTETKPLRLAQPYRGFKSPELRNTYRFTDNVKGPPAAVLRRFATERPEDLLLRANNGAGVDQAIVAQVLERQKFVKDSNAALAAYAKAKSADGKAMDARFVNSVLY